MLCYFIKCYVIDRFYLKYVAFVILGKKKDKMSIRALLMFFIGLMVIIVVMGVVILINTFIFEPLRRFV